jgi:hypothetical protein
LHIFMDESGSFVGLGKIPSPSTIGTLIVPDEKLASLERLYARLRPTLPREGREVKGKLLSEAQVAAVVRILKRNNALFEVNLVELGAHTEASIAAFRARQADAITANLTPKHSPAARSLAEGWRAKVESMPAQLFVQSIAAYDLLIRTLSHATLYHCQRSPRELGAFHWVVDAKEKTPKITPWETWWKDFLGAAIQSSTMARPSPSLECGDYSYFARFQMDWPDYMLERFPELADGPKPSNAQLIFGENLRFSGEPEPGLEMVDILTNAIRRAAIDHLQEGGWKPIRELMIHRNEEPYIHVIGLGDGDGTFVAPYAKVIHAFRTSGRSMVTGATARIA